MLRLPELRSLSGWKLPLELVLPHWAGVGGGKASRRRMCARNVSWTAVGNISPGRPLRGRGPAGGDTSRPGPCQPDRQDQRTNGQQKFSASIPCLEIPVLRRSFGQGAGRREGANRPDVG